LTLGREGTGKQLLGGGTTFEEGRKVRAPLGKSFSKTSGTTLASKTGKGKGIINGYSQNGRLAFYQRRGGEEKLPVVQTKGGKRVCGFVFVAVGS